MDCSPRVLIRCEAYLDYGCLVTGDGHGMILYLILRDMRHSLYDGNIGSKEL
jgi:hypothetical protein